MAETSTSVRKIFDTMKRCTQADVSKPKALRATTARTILPLNLPLGPSIGERHHISHQSCNSYVSTDSKILYQKRIVGYRLHNCIESTFGQRQFQTACFSALHDLSRTASIIPVSVTPATPSCLLTRDFQTHETSDHH